MEAKPDNQNFLKAGARFEKRLYLFVIACLGDQDAAADVLQQAYVTCYRSGAAEARTMEIRAFQAACGLLRAQGGAGGRYGGIPGCAPELALRLSALAPAERAAVALIFLCRFSTEEAAAILRTAPSHVRSACRAWLAPGRAEAETPSRLLHLAGK